MRRLKVVCERRKTRESSRRRTVSERERRSRCSGFRAAVVVVGDEGGVAMELSACCTWTATVMCTYVALVLCT
jgi:hypothetical protein